MRNDALDPHSPNRAISQPLAGHVDRRHRFVMDLVLPAFGLLRASRIFIDQRYGAALLWLWMPVAVLIYFRALDHGALVSFGLLFAVVLFHLYLLTWVVLALSGAWKASTNPFSRSLGIVLAIVVPLGVPVVGNFLFPQDYSSERTASNWFPIAWFIVVVGIGVAWKWATFGSSSSARHSEGSGQRLAGSDPALIDEPYRRRLPLWLVGLPLLVPAALSLAGNLNRELYPWMDQVLTTTRILYAWFAVACLCLYIGLVLWPGREAGIQPEAEDELDPATHQP